MKSSILLLITLTTLLACSKNTPSTSREKDTPDFTFRAKKNGVDWKANALTATYNEKDSMVHILVEGNHNERFSLSFFKKPQFVGKSDEFTAGSLTPTCEHCASIAQLYKLDSAKQNSFEIMGFDNIQNRVLGRFSVYLKKDSLYAGPFTRDSSLYEGVLSTPYKTASF